MKKSETTVILIDDDKKFKDDAITDAIKEHYSQFVFFDNPVEALEYIKQHIKERMIILLDLRFGNLPNGSETLKKIREISKIIPVIIFSATPKTDIDSVTLINNNAFFYLDKDAKNKDVLKILHEADIALQNSLTSAIKEWLEARGDCDTETYIYTLSGKKYSLKEVLNEILLNSEIGQFFEKNINKLSIDLLSRSKEKIDD